MIIDRIVVGKLGVNSYIIGDQGQAAVVDPGAQAELIERKLDEHGLRLKYILLTHGHGDHIGAVLELKEKYQADIILAEGDHDMISNPEHNHSLDICGHAIRFEGDRYVRDKDVIQLGSIEIKCLLTPGHTKGGVCYLAEKYLLTGDTLFNRSVGRTDLYGGSMRDLVNSITSQLMVLDDEVVVLPGHGGQSTIGNERKHNPFL